MVELAAVALGRAEDHGAHRGAHAVGPDHEVEALGGAPAVRGRQHDLDRCRCRAGCAWGWCRSGPRASLGPAVPQRTLQVAAHEGQRGGVVAERGVDPRDRAPGPSTPVTTPSAGSRVRNAPSGAEPVGRGDAVGRQPHEVAPGAPPRRALADHDVPAGAVQGSPARDRPPRHRRPSARGRPIAAVTSTRTEGRPSGRSFRTTERRPRRTSRPRRPGRRRPRAGCRRRGRGASGAERLHAPEVLAAALRAVVAEVVVLVGLAGVLAGAEVHERHLRQRGRDRGAEDGSVGPAVVDQLHGLGASVRFEGGRGHFFGRRRTVGTRDGPGPGGGPVPGESDPLARATSRRARSNSSSGATALHGPRPASCSDRHGRARGERSVPVGQSRIAARRATAARPRPVSARIRTGPDVASRPNSVGRTAHRPEELHRSAWSAGLRGRPPRREWSASAVRRALAVDPCSGPTAPRDSTTRVMGTPEVVRCQTTRRGVAPVWRADGVRPNGVASPHPSCAS